MILILDHFVYFVQKIMHWWKENVWLLYECQKSMIFLYNHIALVRNIKRSI